MFRDLTSLLIDPCLKRNPSHLTSKRDVRITHLRLIVLITLLLLISLMSDESTFSINRLEPLEGRCEKADAKLSG